MAKEWEPAPDGVNFAAIVCEIDKHLAPDATVTSDAGNFASYIHRYLGLGQRNVFLSSVVGAMGSGMPMAVAAALRRPDTQIVAFVGDGGALMTGNEIATALQYGVNPIMIIADNAMYGTIGMHSYVRYPDRPFMDGTRLTNPDFAAWARAFGAEAITIRAESEIAGGLCRSDPPRGGALSDVGPANERVAPLRRGRYPAVTVLRLSLCSGTPARP